MSLTLGFPPRVVVVSGSRSFRPEHLSLARPLLDLLPRSVVIRHGDQGVERDGKLVSGADRLVGELAASMGFKVDAWPADWTRYGRAAGMRRNGEMLVGDASRGPADAVYAWWDGASPGTKNTIDRARRAGLPVTVVRL